VSRVIDFEDSCHRHVERELPWYVNRRLDETARARVERHLSGCSRCRREEAELRSCRESIAAPLPFDPPTPKFAALAQRIAEEERARPGPAPRVAAGRGLRASLWLLATAQAALLAIVLWPMLRAPPPAPYRTLGAEPAPAGAGSSALMMFRPEVTLADARRLLQAQGVRIVEGPNAAGAYLVALPADRPERAIFELRKARMVLLVERVDGEAAGR
jgi:anti-sigma factor RsiW